MGDLISGCLVWIIGLFFLLLTALVLLVFGYDFYSAMNNKYWIYDGGDRAFYTNSYKEENGCIYFKSHFDTDVVQCGSYRITDRDE